MIQLLKDYKVNVQDTWKNELYVDNNFVFTDVNGYPLVIKKLQLWIKAILKKTDITNKQISTHSFRYTHYALLIEAGVHIKRNTRTLTPQRYKYHNEHIRKDYQLIQKTLPKSLVNSWKTSQKDYFKISTTKL